MIECKITNYPEALIGFGREDFEDDESFNYVVEFFESMKAEGIVEEVSE